mgnify:CR=1 FL=1
MKQSHTRYPWLFGLLLVLISIPSLFTINDTRQLYLNSSLREKAKTELESFATAHGFLLSELTVTKITTESIRVDIREYRRGQDAHNCIDITFANHVETPCSKN